MMLMALLLAQAAQAPPPDIELDIRASARSVRIERSGEASLEVRAGPDSVVEVEAPDSAGRRRLLNVEVRVKVEARIADPQAPSQSQEPPPSQ